MSYRVKGRYVYDDGNRINLLAVNVLGMELKEAMIFGLGWGSLTMKEFVAPIKAVGFNAVRLPITSRTISNVEVQPDMIGAYTPAQSAAEKAKGKPGEDWVYGNKHLAGKRSMEICDALIDELEAQGIRYVFDLHYLEEGHPGNIPRLWYTDSYPESKWKADLEALALRYKGRKGFVGIDLRNEPNGEACTWGSGDMKTDWRLACERAYEVISKVNSDIIVWIEALGVESGIDQLVNNPPNIPRDRVSYSMHSYGKSVWSFNPVFKAQLYPQNLPAFWDKMFGNASVSFNVNIGEWGGRSDIDMPFLKKHAEYIRRYELDSFFWAWQGSASGDTGGILIDGGFRNMDPDKVEIIRSMKTQYTTYTTDAVTPKPEVNPVPTPTPVKPLFKQGDQVRLRTSDKPLMTVNGYDSLGMVQVVYYSEPKGEIVMQSLAEFLLKANVVAKASKPALKKAKKK